jgi:hypothetical protein
MAIGIYFSPRGMTSRKYEQCIKDLRKAGAGHPSGRKYHAAFGPKSKLMVFDVWQSRKSFDRFAKTMIPIVKGLGVNPGKPMVMPVHNVIVRPAKKTSRRKTR